FQKKDHKFKESDKDHGWVQFWWPTWTQGTNKDAPPVTDNDVHLFKTDKELQKVMRENLRITMDLFGFKNHGTEKEPIIKPINTFDADFGTGNTWLTDRTKHQQIRLTRLLESLATNGWEPFAK